MKKRLAIVGSVGIPNRYGGPEAFAESVAPELLAKGVDVTVTCDRSRYLDDLSERFRGVRRRFIRIGANGATSPLHDFVAFLAVVRGSSHVLFLGVSGGLFFPLIRAIADILGVKILVNIDGVEWRRDKFSALGKAVLYASDWAAQRFAHVVIYDNEGLRDYVLHPAKSVCVEYSGDHAIAARHDELPAEAASGPYALTVCRIEPENNCDVLIEGFLRSSFARYIFVGNWARSAYGRALKAQYEGEPRLQLLDPVYEPFRLYALRRHCAVYLHGHSVGGTNPSLVEMLFFDCPVLCWDCAFNRETAGNSALFFSDGHSLAYMLDAGARPDGDRAALRKRYTVDAISEKILAAMAKASA